MLAISGRKCAELLPQQDPVGYCVRMLMVTSLWDSMKCSLTWIPSATPGGRPLFRLVPSTPSTGEAESGFLPTPTVQDSNKATKRWREDHQNNLTAYVFNPDKFLPTPAAANWKSAPKNRYQGSPTYKANLDEAVRLSVSAPTHMNPVFCELLMGYPTGWTELRDSETPSCRKSRRKSSDA